LTSNLRKPRAQGWVAFTAAFALAAGTALAAEPPAPSPALPFGPPPAPAWVGVVTDPPGARVWINGLDAGPSPVSPVEIVSGRTVIRAFRGDPRRFQPVEDGRTADVAPGETLFVRLDLRDPVLLRSDPEPARITLIPPRPDARDVAAGDTPLRLTPRRLEGWRVRVGARGYADSVLSGSAIVDLAEGANGSVAITLRSLGLPPAAPPPGPSLLGRRWLHWALIGAGTALTGGAAVLRHKGDRAYEAYLDATRPAEIARLYDRTIHYDRLSSVALGVGQVALTSGLFLFVSGIGR